MTPAFISRLAVVPLCIALFATAVGGAHAQSYPAKPIRFILSHAPGGGTHTLGRIIGQNLSDTLGQPVVVDNRPGAGAYWCRDCR